VDKELGFEIIPLGDGDLVSQSNDLNKWLLTSPIIGYKKCISHEKIILQKLREDRTKFVDFLFLKADDADIFSNQKKTALCTRLSPHSKMVSIGSTHYFTSVITNEASTCVILKNGVIDSDLRPLFPVVGNESNGRLMEIGATDLSNHIGVSLLARTQDGILWGWQQSKRSQQSTRKRVPGGSGSLDWRDIRNAKEKDLLGIIRFGMVRELCEESKLSRKRKREIASGLLVIGYYRWLQRGGKPEFIGVGNAPYDYNELSPQSTEVGGGNVNEGKWPAYTTQDIADYCSFVLEGIHKRISVPLKVICLRLRSIIERDSDSSERAKLVTLWQLKG
jgi:hypothetical protein